MYDTPKAKDRALVLLALTQFLVIIDASIVNVALPEMGTALSIAPENLSWIVNSYTLTFGGFLLLGGRLADHLGRRRMFIVGLVIFSAASLAGGFAQTELWLNVARAIQGLGAAIVSPAALSIITTTFAEGSERNRALGVWGAVAGAGGAFGVIMGGLLTDGLGWEWVLFVNFPIGMAMAYLAPRVLRESRLQGERGSFDIPGAVTVTAGLAVLVFALVRSEANGWGSATTISLLAASAALLALFVAIESRSSTPLMPFTIFRLRTLRGANLIGVLTGAALFSMFYFITLYAQNVLGYSPLETGMAYLPLSVTIIVSAGIASQLVTRVGFKRVLLSGLLCVAVGLLWFSRITPPPEGSFLGDILGPSLVCAVGLGFTFVPVTIAAVTGTEPGEAGLASGLINTSQQVGGALGIGMLVSISSSRSAELGPDWRTDPVKLTEGFQDAFVVGSLFGVVGIVAALLLISSKDAADHAEAARRGEAQTAAA